MRYLVCAIVAILSGVVSGCAGSIDFKDTNALVSAIKVEYSKRDETTTYTGPEYKQGNTKLYLSARRNDRIGITYYLITADTIYFGDLRNYYTASDMSGNKFDFKSNLRRKDYCDNSGCWQEENFELSTSRGYLKAYQAQDLLIKVTGRTDVYQTITLPAAYIKAFLLTVKDP